MKAPLRCVLAPTGGRLLMSTASGAARPTLANPISGSCWADAATATSDRAVHATVRALLQSIAARLAAVIIMEVPPNETAAAEERKIIRLGRNKVQHGPGGRGQNPFFAARCRRAVIWMRTIGRRSPEPRMRVAFFLALLLATSGSAAADLIPPEYVKERFVAPENAPSSIVVAGPEEPGERLVVTGRVLDGGRPLAGISIYVFHADADGLYAREGVNNDENARLHGAMRSDAEGRYRFETVRPRGYDREPAHVHYVVIASGYKPRMFDLWLADDPILEERRRKELPELWFESAPGRIAIRPVTRDVNGTWHAARDLEMLRQ